ncbi:uncharacterized protein LOC115718003 [Cannabis sativa]|uniref:uncharacterized protein LOC115718003 n=1 Tax=Cannabis sativa TaxID=3483 RepID=UPI0029C9E77F|nr:uncharacterized protein LOC115718003 [Cannabis sativa]
MIAISWNARGLGKPSKFRQLRLLNSQQAFHLLFLMETKLSTGSINKIRVALNFPNGFEVPRRGLGGGLMLLWKDNIDVTLLNYSMNHITCYVQCDNIPKFHFSGFYGAAETQLRPHTWRVLKRLADIFPIDPWLVMGDFNEIFSPDLKVGGATRDLTLIDNFHEAVNYDHRALKTEFHTSNDPPLNQKFRSRFRYEALWLNDPECNEIVDRHWTTSDHNSLHQAVQNIHTVSSHLQSWHINKYGNMRRKISNAQKKVSDLRASDISSQAFFSDLHQSERILDDLLEQEETYWHQRSRINWLKAGDANTKYFHSRASGRKANNHIKKLQTNNGELVTGL